MKRRALIGSLALSLCLLITGTVLGAEKLVVATWGWCTDEVKYYDEIHPDIDVELIVIPNSNWGYVEQITTMTIGGSPPDVLWVKSDIIGASLVEQGLLEDLGKWIERTEGLNPEHYHPDVMKGPFDMVVFIPYTTMPYAVYYDRNILADAGVVEPKSGWTFDDFRQILKKITRRNSEGEVEIYGYDDIGRSWPFFGHKGPAGKRLFDDTGRKVIANNPQTIAGYEFFHALIYEDRTIGGPGTNARMNNGRSAMSIWGPGAYRDRVQNGEVGLVSLPAGPGGYAPFVLIEGWGMTATARNKEAAWEFITWMTGPEEQKRFAVEDGGAPGNIPVMVEHAFRDHPYRDVYVEIVTQGKEFRGIPLGTEVPYAVVREANGKFNVGAYWRDEKPLTAIMEEAIPVMQAIIDKWIAENE